MAMNLIKHKGIEMELGGEVYVIPPLSLLDLELLQPQLKAFNGNNVTSAESMKTVVDATFRALRRNYSDLKRDQVAEMLDLGNMVDVMAAVMDLSGMRRKGLEAEKTGAA